MSNSGAPLGLRVRGVTQGYLPRILAWEGFRFGVLHARQTRVMAAVDDGRYARYGMQFIEKMSREIHGGAE